MSDWYNNVRDIRKARQKHNERLEQNVIITPAEIVSQNGSTTVSEHGLSFTWIKLRGGTSIPVAALNMTTLTVEGTPVLAARYPKLPYNWQIIGPDPSFIRAEMTLPVSYYNQGPHGSNHQTADESDPGPDPVDVFQPMMMMLKTEGDGTTLTVTTYPYDYNEGGISKYFAGATTDLTSSVPAAGLIRKDLLYLDRDTNILELVEGTAVIDNGVIPIPLPEVPAGTNATKSAWITLANGQSYVSTADHVDDARDFLGQSTGSSQTTTGEIFLTAAGGWPSKTNGCAPNIKNETATNKQNYYTLDFDQSSMEYAEWTVWMPDDWDGSVVAAIFDWTADSGSGDVAWGLQGIAYVNGDVLDAAWGSAQIVVHSLSAVGENHITGLTNAITIAGAPSPGSLVQFRTFRDPSVGNNLNADAKLAGIKVYYTKTNVSPVNLADLSGDQFNIGSITANATFETTESSSITADAAIEAAESSSVTADATIETTESSSVTADADIV